MGISHEGFGREAFERGCAAPHLELKGVRVSRNFELVKGGSSLKELELSVTD